MKQEIQNEQPYQPTGDTARSLGNRRSERLPRRRPQPGQSPRSDPFGGIGSPLEADRADDDENYAEELADIVIRVMDHAEAEDIDLLDEIQAKNAENRERDYKHGKDY